MKKALIGTVKIGHIIRYCYTISDYEEALEEKIQNETCDEPYSERVKAISELAKLSNMRTAVLV